MLGKSDLNPADYRLDKMQSMCQPEDSHASAYQTHPGTHPAVHTSCGEVHNEHSAGTSHA